MPSIAILGGGPAGAFAGEKLAAAGFPVTVIDEKLAWEKPCGGGLTAKALERYPFLADSAVPKRLVDRAVLVASNGARATLRLRSPIAIYARQVLNGLLLDRARRAGAAIIQDRVIRAERRGEMWRLTGKRGEYEADFCVAATGARNPLRQMGTALGRRDAYVALGYYVPGSLDHLEVQFLHRFEGYLWIFPRPDHLSVGICGKLASDATPRLRRLVEDYMSQHDLPIAGSRFYCHLLPSLAPSSFASNRVAGPGWAAAGDAAGLVDPLTGEGLYYALRSADLLAACLCENAIADYPRRLRADLMDDLQFGSRLTGRFYRGRFLLGSATKRMVQLTRRSPTFASLMQDLFAGSQTYLGLKSRLWRQLGITLWEIAASFSRTRSADSPANSNDPLQISRPV
ncbi:MAG TPA: FAD-dependent oxidoreductase [Bryobacterales bacterium]|nr:FAD-dependent oxidoreductase [Bryobacterales bacterium]